MVFFAMNWVFLLIGLLALSQPGHAIYCHVTSETTSAETYVHPTTRVAVYIPGTWTVFGQPDTENFYRSVFKFTNSSNGVLMHSRNREPAVSTLAGGTKRILFYFNYHPQAVGPVRLQYAELRHQPVRFLLNDTAVTELDITCTTRHLNVLHAATRHGGDVILRFARPVKRCDQNATKLLSNSWFAYASTVCSPSAPDCLAARLIGPCNTTLSDGFVPVEGTNELQWRCKAHSNFSSSALYTNYNVLVGTICDAWDNHTVTPYGAADDEDDPTTLKLLTSISSITPVFYIHPSPESVYHHSLVSVDTVWPVLLSNLTGARPKLLIKYNSGMSNTRCTAISNGRFEYDSIFEYDCKDTSGVALSTYDYFSVRAILEGPSNFFYHLSSTVEVEADSVTDNDELDDGATPIITYHYRVLGFNYLSRNKLLMFINHDWTSLPAVAELVVYDTGGVQYNATNVTRRSPNSYYINFDTENQLPVDFTTLSAYFLAHDSAEVTSHVPVATVMAVTEYETASTGDITLNDIDSMGVKVVIYISFVVTGFVGLYVIYRVIRHGCPKSSRSNIRSSKRRI